MAVEGPDYPPHPPLARPGWARDRRVWITAAVILVAVMLISVFLRAAPTPPVPESSPPADVASTNPPMAQGPGGPPQGAPASASAEPDVYGASGGDGPANPG